MTMYRIFFIFLLMLSLNSYSKDHTFHHPNKLINHIKTSKNPAKVIYKQFCANCHSNPPLIPLNAPIFRHSSDWTERLKQSRSLMFKNVNEGINAMPPRGGCFECSDELLQQTIEFMLPKSD